MKTAASPHPRVGVGDLAPDFPLPPAPGRPDTLAGYRGRSEAVVFFYPKDHTPGCTAEACAFRDAHADLVAAGAAVIGISADTDASHAGFAARHRLPFALVADPGGSIRARFGVPRTFGLLPGRVTYAIDRAGVVRMIYSSQLRPARHAAEALAALRSIRAAGAPAGP